MTKERKWDRKWKIMDYHADNTGNSWSTTGLTHVFWVIGFLVELQCGWHNDQVVGISSSWDLSDNRKLQQTCNIKLFCPKFGNQTRAITAVLGLFVGLRLPRTVYSAPLSL